MKRFFKSLIVCALVAVMAACARHKIIPDDTLALIFHDAFLTNAYIENENIDTDTLNIYEPIFEKYGYTIEDVDPEPLEDGLFDDYEDDAYLDDSAEEVE